MEEKCRDCGGVLFKKVLLDEHGHVAMDVGTRLDLKSDGVDRFFECPHCSAKNVVIEASNPSGVPGLKVSHIKE